MRRSTLMFGAWVIGIIIMGYTCNIPPPGGGLPPPGPDTDNDTLPVHLVDADGEIVGPALSVTLGGGLLYLRDVDRMIGFRTEAPDWEVNLPDPGNDVYFESTDCTGPPFLLARRSPAWREAFVWDGLLWTHGDDATGTTVRSRTANGQCLAIPEEVPPFLTATVNITPENWPPTPPLTIVFPDLP